MSPMLEYYKAMYIPVVNMFPIKFKKRCFRKQTNRWNNNSRC